MAPNLVLEHLYIASLPDVCNADNLRLCNIQAIMTVDTKPLMGRVIENYVYTQVPLLDIENEDILSHLVAAVEWIEELRTQAKSVIVHCNAGQSRSAAIIIGYLMWKLQMGYDDSLQYLRKLKPDVMPNSGFAEQLRMYEYMEWKIDKSNQAYRCYQLARISEMISTGHSIGHIGDMLDSFQDVSGARVDAVTYKCKKCRRLLFTDENILLHNEGVGQSAFSRPWQKSTVTNAVECKSSIFIEPVKWMQRLVLREVQGKISCFNCAAKIGSWAWSGERCCCGTWVTPAFHIDSKKVDRSLPLRTREVSRTATSSS